MVFLYISSHQLWKNKKQTLLTTSTKDVEYPGMMLITKRKKEDHDDTNYKTFPKGIQGSLKKWKGARMSLDGKIQNYSGAVSLQSNQYDSKLKCCYCSVTKSCLTLCDLLQKLLCPPLSPGVCANSCPLSQWRHPSISSPAAHFALCLQSFPASGSFSVSWLFTSGGQSMGASASATVLPMNI